MSRAGICQLDSPLPPSGVTGRAEGFRATKLVRKWLLCDSVARAQESTTTLRKIMGLLDDIREIFDVNTLYEVFDVEKTASVDQIKKAYRKKSLLCHPDKAQPEVRDEATRKFQTLCKSYDVLQDVERRKIYDETGDVDDESIDSKRDWNTYWRNLFPKITTNQISVFMERYIGSENEKKDLKRIYEKCKGDMNKICEYHVSYNIDDEDRLNSLLNDMIEAGQVKDYPAFSEESEASKQRRRERFEKEAREAKKLAAEAGHSKDQDELALLILGNQQKRASDSEKFIAELEAKYAPKAKRRAKGKK